MILFGSFDFSTSFLSCFAVALLFPALSINPYAQAICRFSSSTILILNERTNAGAGQYGERNNEPCLLLHLVIHVHVIMYRNV